jgi:hypothetical protein
VAARIKQGRKPSLIEGAMFGDRVLRFLQTSAFPKDEHTKKLAELEREFRGLPGTLSFKGFISLRRRLYRYLVLRTLGEAVLGSTPADAARAAVAS